MRRRAPPAAPDRAWLPAPSSRWRPPPLRHWSWPPRLRPLPNILVIVTDDQPKDTLDAMPNLRQRVVDRGLTFRNGIIPTSLCCSVPRVAADRQPLAHDRDVDQPG